VYIAMIINRSHRTGRKGHTIELIQISILLVLCLLPIGDCRKMNRPDRTEKGQTEYVPRYSVTNYSYWYNPRLRKAMYGKTPRHVRLGSSLCVHGEYKICTREREGEVVKEKFISLLFLPLSPSLLACAHKKWKYSIPQDKNAKCCVRSSR
jgi:hypothetical protein